MKTEGRITKAAQFVNAVLCFLTFELSGGVRVFTFLKPDIDIKWSTPSFQS